jgi:hypothetical protein
VLTHAGLKPGDFAMSQESELEKARAQLVEQRRVIIKALADGKALDAQVELLLKFQSGIDVLDTLMAEGEDEEDEEDEE